MKTTIFMMLMLGLGTTSVVDALGGAMMRGYSSGSKGVSAGNNTAQPTEPAKPEDIAKLINKKTMR